MHTVGMLLILFLTTFCDVDTVRWNIDKQYIGILMCLVVHLYVEMSCKTTLTCMYVF